MLNYVFPLVMNPPVCVTMVTQIIAVHNAQCHNFKVLVRYKGISLVLQNYRYSGPSVIWTSSIQPLGLFGLGNDCVISFVKKVCFIRVFGWSSIYNWMGFITQTVQSSEHNQMRYMEDYENPTLKIPA